MERAEWHLEMNGRTPRVTSEDYVIEPRRLDPFTYSLRRGAIRVGPEGEEILPGQAEHVFGDVAAAMRAATAHSEPGSNGAPDPPLLPTWHLVANRAHPPKPFLKTDSELRLEPVQTGYVVCIARNRWVSSSGVLGWAPYAFPDVLDAMRATARFVFRRSVEDSRPAARRRAIEPTVLYKIEGEEIVTVEGYFSDGTKIYKPQAPKRRGSSPGYEVVDCYPGDADCVGYESVELAVEAFVSEARRAFEEADHEVLRAHEACAGSPGGEARTRMERALRDFERARRDRDAALALDAKFTRKAGGRRERAKREFGLTIPAVRSYPIEPVSSTAPRLRKRAEHLASPSSDDQAPVHLCRAPRDASAVVVDDCQRCQEVHRVARVRLIHPRRERGGVLDQDETEFDDGLSGWIQQIADSD